MLATVYRDGIALWDVSSGKEIRRLKTGEAHFHRIVFSPNSKTLATSGPTGPTVLRQIGDRKVPVARDPGAGLMFWDVETGKRRLHLPNVDTIVLAFSPDSKLLAAEGENYGVCVWDVTSGKERHCFAGHRARVSALAFSSDGRRLISGSWDATAFLWDVPQDRKPPK
jgi:WD40 repeat protein